MIMMVMMIIVIIFIVYVLLRAYSGFKPLNYYYKGHYVQFYTDVLGFLLLLLRDHISYAVQPLYFNSFNSENLYQRLVVPLFCLHYARDHSVDILM
jgi:hypothetical protein